MRTCEGKSKVQMRYGKRIETIRIAHSIHSHTSHQIGSFGRRKTFSSSSSHSIGEEEKKE